MRTEPRPPTTGADDHTRRRARPSRRGSAAVSAGDALAAFVPRLLLDRATHVPGHWQAEGTLVYADVSGFTRLTEKLSRRGKAGAEEIVRTISDVFTILLTATADGGDVLKFSGDALVVFFDGDAHAQRACHAALRMQRVLAAVGGIDSSRGRVRLRMSVGVHTGTFSFFVCGDDHLELFVLGPAASTTVAAETAATAGQVLVSTSTAAALKGATLRERPGNLLVLRRLPDVAPVASPMAAQRGDATRYIAPPLRARLTEDDLDHEHRRATVAFMHFGGVDDVLAREGADGAFAHVQALTTATMHALATYGVLLTATDVARGGGTFMLTAGAPDATGDDEARMLRVARAVLEAGSPLPLRIGINAGDVFVGAVGTPWRRTYSTMGAATNLAARVMTAAPPGGALATAAVLDAVGERFMVAPVPPFTVKGRDAPVDAGLVEGATNAVVAATDRSVPLTGRDRELAVLTTALAEAVDGRGGVVQIVGAPGMGKSRLIDELRANAGAIAWVHVTCDPYEATTPYHTSALLLRRTLGLSDDGAGGRVAPERGEAGGDSNARGADAGGVGGVTGDAVGALAAAITTVDEQLLAWLPLIGVAAGVNGIPDTPQTADVTAAYRRGRIHQAIGDLLSALPDDLAVIVLDDAHHADDASAELIAALIARLLRSKPWLVVTTHATTDTGVHAGRGYDATTLRLGPLEPSTAADLAARLAEHTPVPTHLMDDLVSRAAGNPLFLASLVATQASGRQLPQTVEAILAARIDELDPDDRRALRYLSVLGDRFDTALLDTALSTRGVSSEQTDRWRRLAEFVAVDGAAVAFRYPLVREVAYEGLAFRMRRQLHALAADALRARPDTAPARLAVHLLRAERWADAWQVAREAAASAQATGANAVAGELFDMALRAARRLDVADTDVAAVATDAGEVWQRAGMWQRALDAYSIAAKTAPDDESRTNLMLLRAQAHEGGGRYAQALRSYSNALRTTAQLSPAAIRERYAARAHAGHASVRLGQARPADAIDHGLLAVEHARRGGDDQTLAQAHHLLDRAHTALGNDQSAAEHRDRALPVFAALGDLAAQGTVLHDLGAAAQRAGRSDEALWLYERGYETRWRAGDVVRAADTANAIGEVLLDRGRVGDARERFAEALRIWRGARSPLGIAEATRNLGRALLREGAHVQALDVLDEAAATAARISADGLVEQIQLPRAEALLAAGRYVEAWDAATQALHSDRLRPAAHRLRGAALLHTGGTVRAREELTLALRLSERAGDDATRSVAQHLLDTARSEV